MFQEFLISKLNNKDRKQDKLKVFYFSTGVCVWLGGWVYVSGVVFAAHSSTGTCV